MGRNPSFRTQLVVLQWEQMQQFNVSCCCSKICLYFEVLFTIVGPNPSLHATNNQTNIMTSTRTSDPSMGDMQQKNISLDTDKVQDLLGLNRTWEPGKIIATL